MSGLMSTLVVRSWPWFHNSEYDGTPSFLDSYRLQASVEPLTPSALPYATTMLAPTAPTSMQKASLSHNECKYFVSPACPCP